jgi:hypothetical protein
MMEETHPMAQSEQPSWRTFVMEANAATTGFQPGPITEAAAPMALPGAPHISPSFDPIELLPPAAADKLRKLRLRKDDAHRLIPEFETVRSASLAKIDAANALNTLVSHPQDFGKNLPETDPLVIAAKKHLDKMTAEFKRLTELQEIRSAAFRSAGAAVANVEDWLKSGKPSGVLLQDHDDGPEPTLAKGENGLLDAVENRRRRVRELRADLHRIASAPFPSSYAKQRMRAQIEALAMQGPSVSRLVELDGPVEFQTQRLTSEVHAERRSLAFTEVADAVALVAWLHRDALIAALDREIASESDDKSALSHADRELRTAEVMGDLLDIERQEAALTWSAMEQGLPIEHRSDISPLALLGVRLVTVPRANASRKHRRDIRGRVDEHRSRCRCMLRRRGGPRRGQSRPHKVSRRAGPRCLLNADISARLDERGQGVIARFLKSLTPQR